MPFKRCPIDRQGYSPSYMTSRRPPGAPRIAIGTCGFSYKDWVGPVYPLGTKSAEMLELYAREFPTVEIDATYYRVPGIATFESMARRTPEGFRFAAKLPGTGTHLPDAGSRKVHEDVLHFRENLSPLIDAGKFACVPHAVPEFVQAKRCYAIVS